jgi:hypothetical protein
MLIVDCGGTMDTWLEVRDQVLQDLCWRLKALGGKPV